MRWYAFAILSMMLSVIAMILEVEKESNRWRACLTHLSRSEMELQRRAVSLPLLICGRQRLALLVVLLLARGGSR